MVSSTDDLNIEGSFLLDWCGSAFKIEAGILQQRIRLCNLYSTEVMLDAFDEQTGGTIGLCCKAHQNLTANVASLPNETMYARKLVHLEDIVRTVRSDDGEIAAQTPTLEIILARVTYEKFGLLYQRCDAAVAVRASSWRYAMLCASATLIFCNSPDVLTNSRIPDDVLHLYDKLIEVTGEMIPLTMLSTDESLGERLCGRTAILNAYRCYFLAETFALLVQSRRAFALLYRATYLSGRALQEAEACEALQLSQEMTHLGGATCASSSRLRAELFLYRKYHSCARRHFHLQPLRRTPPLDKIDANAWAKFTPSSLSLAIIPPRSHGVWCQPMLFDLAQTHLILPCFQRRAQQGTRRGLLSWFQRR